MKQYFEEISKYKIDKERALDFLIDKQASPDFNILKSFIMDMAEIDNYDYLFYAYFDCTRGIDVDINDKQKIYDEALNGFVSGNNPDEFMDFIIWIKDMAELFDGVELFSYLTRLKDEYRNIAYFTECINSKDIDKEELDAIKGRIETSKNNIEKLKEELRNNYELRESKNFDDQEVEKVVEMVDKLVKKTSHFYSEINVLDGINNDVKKINDDIFFAIKTAQNFNDIVEYTKNNPDFKSVVSYIRNFLIENANSMRNPITNEFRTDDLDYSFLKGSTSKPEEIEEQFDNLAKEYEEIMKIEDKNEFVKRVADFHFNYLKVHPFLEGNGRTARILLKVMLASRDIYLPSLYNNETDKYLFYERSNDALKGNYETTEEDLMGYYESQNMTAVYALQQYLNIWE